MRDPSKQDGFGYPQGIIYQDFVDLSVLIISNI